MIMNALSDASRDEDTDVVDLNCPEAMDIVREDIAMFLRLTCILEDTASAVQPVDVMTMYFTPRLPEDAFTRADGNARLLSRRRGRCVSLAAHSRLPAAAGEPRRHDFAHALGSLGRPRRAPIAPVRWQRLRFGLSLPGRPTSLAK
jgi:hypothetical protein